MGIQSVHDCEQLPHRKRLKLRTPYIGNLRNTSLIQTITVDAWSPMTEPTGAVETCDRPSKRHQAYNPQYMESSVRSHADSLPDQPPVVTRPTGGHHRVRALDVASSLTPTEAQVLDCMIKAVKHADSKTVVRIAGGWVRDKLLGLENEDIDVALDNCSGVAFAEVLNAYLESQGQSKSKVAKIEANPEQSKHLETARMKIMGIWVDLVNLRTEIYRSDSRIPDTLFGTAKEDALRRDFTLNALFYNVNEGKVEDMTGRGLEDLKAGIIRTPLPAMMTFRDDPLRVLRAVRFAARFGFTLHQDIYNAARDAETQTALRTKVSRERLGAELSGMLTGKMAQPGLALSMLQELCLCDAVYAPPDDLVPPAPEAGFDWASGAAVARAAARILASGSLRSERPDRLAPSAAVIGMEAVSNRGSGEAIPSSKTGSVDATSSDSQFLDERQRREEKVAQTAEENNGKEKTNGKKEDEAGGGTRRSGRPETLVRELFLCAALLPLAGVKHRVKKGRFEAAAQSVVLESLKLKRKEATSVGNILSLMPTFRSLANGCTTPPESSATIQNESKSEFSRLTVGLAIREAKELWPTCVNLCCAMEMYEGEHCTRLSPESCVHDRVENNERAVGHDADSHAFVEKRAGLEDVDDDVASKNEKLVTKKYACLFNSVAGMGLERAWEMTPLIRGNELIAELQVPKGPLVGKLVAEQASWQLEHPEGTREQCVAFLKKALAQMR